MARPAMAVVVSWDGPHQFEDVRDRKGAALYMVWGRHRLGRNPTTPRLLYVGISENAEGVGRRIREHEGRPFAHTSNRWWIGDVVAPEGAGRGPMEAAEWMLVRFAAAEVNEKKAVRPPPYRAYLINQWYRPGSDGLRYERRFGIMLAVPTVMTWSPDSRRFRFAERLLVVDSDG